MGIINRFWQPEIEKMQPKEIKSLQLKRLKHILKYVYDNNSFYRSVLNKKGLDPSSIKSLTDLPKIPFTTKEDFKDNYPFGLLSVPLEKISRIQTSSGTTGDPTVVAYTQNDLEIWSECIARCLTMTGVGKEDIFQVILGYGLFTGGLGFHYGAERIGAKVIPASTGNTKRQVKLIKDFGVTAFTSIPSYTLYMAEVAREEGVDVETDLKIKTISCGAESWSQSTRTKIENTFCCSVFNSYGIAEIIGPGVAFECVMQDGLHVWEDHFLVEVIDPKTGEPVEVEEKGEIVLTTLTKEAMPLIRYRTRDIASILDEEICGCQRSHTKISWISGRTDEMIKIRGVNVFPSQIEYILMKMPNSGSNYQLVVTRERYLDELTVRIEIADEILFAESKRVHFKNKLLHELETILGLKVSVELLKRGSLPRSEGKAQKIIDLRKNSFQQF